MVEEARAYRERVLSELARRRELARQQIEQLVHGRDRLLEVFERARLVAVDVVAEISPLGSPEEYVDFAPPTGPDAAHLARPSDCRRRHRGRRRASPRTSSRPRAAPEVAPRPPRTRRSSPSEATDGRRPHGGSAALPDGRRRVDRDCRRRRRRRRRPAGQADGAKTVEEAHRRRGRRADEVRRDAVPAARRGARPADRRRRPQAQAGARRRAERGARRAAPQGAGARRSTRSCPPTPSTPSATSTPSRRAACAPPWPAPPSVAAPVRALDRRADRHAWRRCATRSAPSLVAPLRDRLERCVADGDGDNDDDHQAGPRRLPRVEDAAHRRPARRRVPPRVRARRARRGRARHADVLDRSTRTVRRAPTPRTTRSPAPSPPVTRIPTGHTLRPAHAGCRCCSPPSTEVTSPPMRRPPTSLVGARCGRIAGAIVLIVVGVCCSCSSSCSAGRSPASTSTTCGTTASVAATCSGV